MERLTSTSSGSVIARVTPTQPQVLSTSGISAIPFIWTPASTFLNSVSMSGGLSPTSIHRSCQYRPTSSTRTRCQTTHCRPSWSRRRIRRARLLNQFSLFAQDEWKISKALSLSLGARWEVDPAAKGEHGHDAYTVEGDIHAPESLHLAPRGTPLWRTGWYNVAPRAGVAWAIHRDPGKELILRAGAGVFFDTGDQPGLRAFSGLGFANSAHFANVPLPVAPSELDISAPGAPYTGTNAFAFPSHLQLPYNWQWNIALEKALGRSQTLDYLLCGF